MWQDQQILQELVNGGTCLGGLLRWIPGMHQAGKGRVTCLSKLHHWIKLLGYWRCRFNRTATNLSPKENLYIPMEDLTGIVSRMADAFASLMDFQIQNLLDAGAKKEVELLIFERDGGMKATEVRVDPNATVERQVRQDVKKFCQTQRNKKRQRALEEEEEQKHQQDHVVEQGDARLSQPERNDEEFIAQGEFRKNKTLALKMSSTTHQQLPRGREEIVDVDEGGPSRRLTTLNSDDQANKNVSLLMLKKTDMFENVLDDYYAESGSKDMEGGEKEDLVDETTLLIEGQNGRFRNAQKTAIVETVPSKGDLQEFIDLRRERSEQYRREHGTTANMELEVDRENQNYLAYSPAGRVSMYDISGRNSFASKDGTSLEDPSSKQSFSRSSKETVVDLPGANSPNTVAVHAPFNKEEEPSKDANTMFHSSKDHKDGENSKAAPEQQQLQDENIADAAFAGSGGEQLHATKSKSKKKKDHKNPPAAKTKEQDEEAERIKKEHLLARLRERLKEITERDAISGKKREVDLLNRLEDLHYEGELAMEENEELLMYICATLQNFDTLCTAFEDLERLLANWREDILPKILARDRFMAITRARRAKNEEQRLLHFNHGGQDLLPGGDHAGNKNDRRGGRGQENIFEGGPQHSGDLTAKNGKIFDYNRAGRQRDSCVCTGPLDFHDPRDVHLLNPNRRSISNASTYGDDRAEDRRSEVSVFLPEQARADDITANNLQEDGGGPSNPNTRNYTEVQLKALDVTGGLPPLSAETPPTSTDIPCGSNSLILRELESMRKEHGLEHVDLYEDEVRRAGANAGSRPSRHGQIVGRLDHQRRGGPTRGTSAARPTRFGQLHVDQNHCVTLPASSQLMEDDPRTRHAFGLLPTLLSVAAKQKEEAELDRLMLSTNGGAGRGDGAAAQENYMVDPLQVVEDNDKSNYATNAGKIVSPIRKLFRLESNQQSPDRLNGGRAVAAHGPPHDRGQTPCAIFKKQVDATTSNVDRSCINTTRPTDDEFGAMPPALVQGNYEQTTDPDILMNDDTQSIDCQVTYSWRFTHFLGSLSYLLEDWSGLAEQLLRLSLPQDWNTVHQFKKRLIQCRLHSLEWK
ncbi:unnamed protein product [Amoebophrya sp. A120]|nr:unnamed protein product [Amoebophrya sp. A120]|eukprot:GSA120T00011333001.1